MLGYWFHMRPFFLFARPVRCHRRACDDAEPREISFPDPYVVTARGGPMFVLDREERHDRPGRRQHGPYPRRDDRGLESGPVPIRGGFQKGDRHLEDSEPVPVLKQLVTRSSRRPDRPPRRSDRRGCPGGRPRRRRRPPRPGRWASSGCGRTPPSWSGGAARRPACRRSPRPSRLLAQDPSPRASPCRRSG